MIRDNNHLSPIGFIDVIHKYNEKHIWKNDIHAYYKLHNFVSKNMANISECVASPKERQTLAVFAKRIKDEFLVNNYAEDIANDINCHINAEFFCPEITQKIFSYIVGTSRWLPPGSGLQDAGRVSKSFNDNVNVVKKKWVEDTLMSLKIYGLRSAKEVIDCVIENDLKHINVVTFLDFNQEHLKTLFIRQPNILTLKINSATILEWPKMEALQNLIPVDATDKDIEALAKSAPNLKKIVLFDTDLTNLGAKALAKGCAYLEEIYLTFSGVTDDGIVALAAACHKLLKIHLDIEVTDKGVEALAEGCPRLKLINLNGSKVTDAGLIALSKGCHELEEIDLTGTEVTVLGVGAILQTCKRLLRINLSEMDNITKDQIGTIRLFYPHLKIDF